MSHVGCANRLGKKRKEKKGKNVSYVRYGRVSRMLFASCLGEQTAVHSVYVLLYARLVFTVVKPVLLSKIYFYCLGLWFSTVKD